MTTFRYFGLGQRLNNWQKETSEISRAEREAAAVENCAEYIPGTNPLLYWNIGFKYVVQHWLLDIQNLNRQLILVRGRILNPKMNGNQLLKIFTFYLFSNKLLIDLNITNVVYCRLYFIFRWICLSHYQFISAMTKIIIKMKRWHMPYYKVI